MCRSLPTPTAYGAQWDCAASGVDNSYIRPAQVKRSGYGPS